MVEKFSPRWVLDTDVNINFKNVEKFSQQVILGRLLDNVIITGIELSTSITQVAHKLGRRPLGWIVVRKNSGVNVWEPSNSDSPARLINLQASGIVTIDLLFF
jgi:hypothetical protein